MKKIFIYIKSFIDFVVLKIIQLFFITSSAKRNNILFIITGQIGDLIVTSSLLEKDSLFSTLKESNQEAFFLKMELLLQETGVGLHRHYGCGIFIPHKGIKAVGETEDKSHFSGS